MVFIGQSLVIGGFEARERSPAVVSPRGIVIDPSLRVDSEGFRPPGLKILELRAVPPEVTFLPAVPARDKLGPAIVETMRGRAAALAPNLLSARRLHRRSRNSHRHAEVRGVSLREADGTRDGMPAPRRSVIAQPAVLAFFLTVRRLVVAAVADGAPAFPRSPEVAGKVDRLRHMHGAVISRPSPAVFAGVRVGLVASIAW